MSENKILNILKEIKNSIGNISDIGHLERMIRELKNNIDVLALKIDELSVKIDEME